MPNVIKHPNISYNRIIKPPTKLPFCIHKAGRNKNIWYHSTRGTYNNDATINLIVGGKGYFRHNKKETVVSKGDIILVPPSNNSGLLFADKNKPYDQYYCRFNGTEGLKVANRISEKEYFIFRQEDIAETLELFRQITILWLRDETISTYKMKPIDCLLALLLSKLEEEYRHTHTQVTTDNLYIYMEDNINEPIYLDKMANKFGVSKGHLCRISKEILGGTLHCIWEEMKINWAKELLVESSLNIYSLARHVGYKDSLYFSKVFKKKTGYNPTEWRKKFQSK